MKICGERQCMAIPTYERIMLPLLEVLKDDKVYTNNECIKYWLEN